jgi:Recombination directionality factor-like
MDRSILGDVKLRVPVGGRIRAGMKVLKRSAAQKEHVKKIYDEGLAAGLDFDAIGQRLEVEAKEKGALIPFNAPWFTVRRADFRVPQIADDLIAKYGEVRPEHPDVKHLYAFPIVLATDNWLDVIPHSFQCFVGNTLKYWADYDQAGNRMCYTHASVEVDEFAKRKQFPKRTIMLRQENQGHCEPERCSEYASGACKLRGFVRFYVHGMRGMSLFEIPTTSFYSLTGIRGELEQLTRVRGRISGLHNGKPLLWVTKERREISRYSQEHRRYVREKQWLVVFHVLEESVEALMDSSVKAPPLLAQAQQKAPAAPVPAASPPASNAAVKELRKELNALLHERDVPIDVFSVRAEELHGLGWGRNERALRALLDEAKRCPDVESYHELIAEGEVSTAE